MGLLGQSSESVSKVCVSFDVTCMINSSAITVSFPRSLYDNWEWETISWFVFILNINDVSIILYLTYYTVDIFNTAVLF